MVYKISYVKKSNVEWSYVYGKDYHLEEMFYRIEFPPSSGCTCCHAETCQKPKMCSLTMYIYRLIRKSDNEEWTCVYGYNGTNDESYSGFYKFEHSYPSHTTNWKRVSCRGERAKYTDLEQRCMENCRKNSDSSQLKTQEDLLLHPRVFKQVCKFAKTSPSKILQGLSSE